MTFTVIAGFDWAEGEEEWMRETFGPAGIRWGVGNDLAHGTEMRFEREEDAMLYTLRWL